MRNLILATLMLCAAQSAAQQPATHIDAARHEVSFDVGPFDVPAMNVHAMHGMSHENGVQSAVQLSSMQATSMPYALLFSAHITGSEAGSRKHV